MYPQAFATLEVVVQQRQTLDQIIAPASNALLMDGHGPYEVFETFMSEPYFRAT